MEIEVLKVQANYAEFLLKGERHTFPNLLKDYLLKDSAVSFVSYMLEHPMDKDAKFVIRTTGKSVSSVLAQALKKIETDLTGFEKALKKAVK